MVQKKHCETGLGQVELQFWSYLPASRGERLDVPGLKNISPCLMLSLSVYCIHLVTGIDFPDP